MSERYGEFEQVNGAVVNAALYRAEKAEKERDTLLALVKRARQRVIKWAEKYAENDPKWLPPHGDTAFLEDVDEAIEQIEGKA